MSATIEKSFPVDKTTAKQVMWVLKKRGSKTAWELWDTLKKEGCAVTYATVQSNLGRLRNKKLVGVVMWKEEKKRHKRPRRYYYSHQQDKRVGQPSGGVEEVEVWAAVSYET